MPPRRSNDPGWLDEERPEDFVAAVDSRGETVGWMTRRDVNFLHQATQIIETPERWLKDPWVRNHAVLIGERHFYDGRDLNDVQVLMLASNLISDRRVEADAKNAQFEEDFFFHDREGYNAYIDKKKETEAVEGPVEVEQRVPGSVDEFLATLAAFSEGDQADSGKEQEDEAAGWLSSILSDDDLSEMGE